MKNYDKAGTCIKCGYGGIEDKHFEGFNPDEQLIKIESERIPERIARTCKNCGYSWEESPLDGIELPDSCAEVTDADCEHGSCDTCGGIDDDIKLAPGWDRVAKALGITNKALLNFFNRNKPDPGTPNHSTSEAIKEAMARREMTAPGEAITKGFERADDAPVIEIRDIVANDDPECEGSECEVLNVDRKELDEAALMFTDKEICCACNCRLHHLTLLRKGPKVHTFKKVAWSTAQVHGAPELWRHSPFVGCDNFDTFKDIAESDKRYTITVNEEATK